MQLKSILNHVEPLKSFVYKQVRIIEVDGAPTVIEVDIEPRANGRPICSGCGKKRPQYDRQNVRRWQFVPLWGISVFFVYSMRRVACPACGVKVEQVPKAMNVLDRFHIMKNMNTAIDEVRRTEVAELKRDGFVPILKHSRWCLLKRRENLTEPQAAKLDELLKYNLKSVKAMLLRDDFQQFWTYMRPGWAMKFLDSWCERAKESGLEQMQKVAKSLQHHRRLLANWFHAKGEISSGVVEGFNGKTKLTIRKAYGLRTPEGIKIALFHTLGRLPEPEGTHRFC